MLMYTAPRDANVGTEKQQLLDLECKLLEAKQQLAGLKTTARAMARLQKESNCAVYHKKYPQEVVQARMDMSSKMDKKSCPDLAKKIPRIQTRRHQAGRLPALHNSPGNDGSAVYLDQMSANTDGLLLAVDKFLSSEESQHPIASAGTTC